MTDTETPALSDLSTRFSTSNDGTPIADVAVQLTPADRLRAWREAGGVSGPRRDPIEKLAERPESLRLAVTAKCYDCVGQDADASWQWRIGNCGVTGCPLYAVRPYQSQVGRPTPATLRDVVEEVSA